MPGDYKAVAAAYGPLDIGARLWLHMPCINRGWFDYGAWAQQTRRNAPASFLRRHPYRRHTFYWDTAASNDPDQWPAVMHCQDDENAGHDPWRRFTTPLVPTLARLVAEDLPPPGRRDEDPSTTLNLSPSTQNQPLMTNDSPPHRSSSR
ncbi:hypothetical protein [Streptomyces tendae]|uniref:hypothetical protein n=1 Tax=Streptomyces tendae TaxID=1932 RepID=UPI003717FADB